MKAKRLTLEEVLNLTRLPLTELYNLKEGTIAVMDAISQGKPYTQSEHPEEWQDVCNTMDYLKLIECAISYIEKRKSITL